MVGIFTYDIKKEVKMIGSKSNMLINFQQRTTREKINMPFLRINQDLLTCLYQIIWQDQLGLMQGIFSRIKGWYQAVSQDKAYHSVP